MEKVIEEIRKTEELAEEMLGAAKAKADEIASAALKDEEALRTKFELDYKENSSNAVLRARAQINELKTKENERLIKQNEELKQKTNDKLLPCADYVIEYIFREFVK